MSISIIIPTQNRGKLIEITLNSIIASNFNATDFEVLIVDNISIDNTKEIIAEYIIAHKQFNIKYFYEPMPGAMSARHKGAKEAKGEILVFIDEDVIVSENWLQAIHDSFLDNSVSLVGGRNLPEFEIEPPEWLYSFYTPSVYGGWYQDVLSLQDFGEKEQIISPFDVWGLNYSIRKDIFFKIGGYNPDSYPKKFQKYQGDGDSGLSWKLMQRGINTALYQPRALIKHMIPAGRLTVEFFERKYFYFGLCESYRKIRGKYLDVKPSFAVRCVNKVNSILNQFVKGENSKKKEPNEISVLKKKFENARKNGFKYHQDEARNDKELIRWITKANYFDYTISGFTPEQIDETINIRSY